MTLRSPGCVPWIFEIVQKLHSWMSPLCYSASTIPGIVEKPVFVDFRTMLWRDCWGWEMGWTANSSYCLKALSLSMILWGSQISSCLNSCIDVHSQKSSTEHFGVWATPSPSALSEPSTSLIILFPPEICSMDFSLHLLVSWGWDRCFPWFSVLCPELFLLLPKTTQHFEIIRSYLLDPLNVIS